VPNRRGGRGTPKSWKSAQIAGIGIPLTVPSARSRDTF